MNKISFPVLLILLCIGLADVAGPLAGLAKDTFMLTNFEAQFVCFAGYIMFGIMTIPVRRFLFHFGLKLTILPGLALAFTGLVIPVMFGMYGSIPGSTIPDGALFYLLLFSVLLIGTSASIFSHAFGLFMHGIGTRDSIGNQGYGPHFMAVAGASAGFLLPPFAVYFLNLNWMVLFPVYAVLVAITWFVVSSGKMTEGLSNKIVSPTKPVFGGLLSDTRVVLMAIAIFLYAGSEVSMFSGLPMLLKEKCDITDQALWTAWLLFFLPLTAGRLFGTFLFKRIPLQPFLLISSLLAFCGILLLTIGSSMWVFPGIVIAGLGFSNIFRLVYTMTESYLPGQSAELKRLFITALSGGAILPLLMGLIADAGESVAMGFIAPLIAILYIFFLSIISRPEDRAEKTE